MYDRKVANIKNKKCIISSDYVHKIIAVYKGRNKIPKNNIIFTKIESSQNIDISKEKPLILFNISKKKTNNIENEIKKDLINNQGYLNNDALKYNLLRFYSNDINNKKNNNKKNKNKYNTYTHFFRSVDINHDNNKEKAQSKRDLRIDYSVKIRKRLKSSKSKTLKNNNFLNKNEKNNLSIGKEYLKLIKDMKNIEKGKSLEKKIEKNNNNINNINERKKQYLKENNISYEHINLKDIENEKNEKKEKKVKLFENGKYIKKMIKTNINGINKKLQDRKKRNIKPVKNSVYAMEYMKKINKEIKNLKNGNNNL